MLLLAHGNSFWSFGDSFFGLISEYRNRLCPSNLPRNTAMIQTGEESYRDFMVLNELCSTNPNDSERYHKGKTWLRQPRATELSQREIDNGSLLRDLLGREVASPIPGHIYIRHGKKVLFR